MTSIALPQFTNPVHGSSSSSALAPPSPPAGQLEPASRLESSIPAPAFPAPAFVPLSGREPGVGGLRGSAKCTVFASGARLSCRRCHGQPRQRGRCRSCRRRVRLSSEAQRCIDRRCRTAPRRGARQPRFVFTGYVERYGRDVKFNRKHSLCICPPSPVSFLQKVLSVLLQPHHPAPPLATSRGADLRSISGQVGESACEDHETAMTSGRTVCPEGSASPTSFSEHLR